MSGASKLVPRKAAQRYFDALHDYRSKQRCANRAQARLKVAEREVQDSARRRP
jgi:hypothetical protein